MQQGHAIPLPAFGIVATRSIALRTTLLALLSIGIATTLAILIIPDDPSAEGALFYPALVMSAGLATAPLVTGFRYPKALLRGERPVRTPYEEPESTTQPRPAATVPQAGRAREPGLTISPEPQPGP